MSSVVNSEAIPPRRAVAGTGVLSRRRWIERSVLVLVIVLLVLLGRESATRSVDFPVYHRAAQQILAGNYELYPPEAYGGQPGPSQGFRYAPAVAFLFLPLGWLPLEAAALVFYVLKLAAAWYMGVTVARHAGLTERRRAVLIAAFLVVGGYIAEEFRFGNAHFFSVALMVFAFDRAEAGWIVAPAAALAVAIAMKLTPLALLAYFALRRRTALCMATVAMLAFLVVAPAGVMGWSGNLRQLDAFRTYAFEKVDEGDNYSLRGALVRYLAPGYSDVSHVQANVAELSPAAITGIWLIGLAALGLFALAAMWHDDGDPVVRLLEFSIVMTGILLASPHTQRRYYVALYVPVVALVALLLRTPREPDRRMLLTGLIATAAPATVLPLVFGGRRLALLYEAASPYFFGALVLFGALLVLTVRRKAGHRPPLAEPTVA